MKRATRIPSGAEKSVARPIRISVPTSGAEIPPAVYGSAGGSMVRKSHEIAGNPSTRIFPRIKPSGTREMNSAR